MEATIQPPKRRSLFDIGDDLLAIEQLIEEAEGDISDLAVEAAVTGWLKESAAEQAKKADGYVNLMRKWETEAVAAKAEAELYSKRAKVRTSRFERLKELLKQHMEATHQTKIETVTGRTIAIQANGGKSPMFVDAGVNPKALEERFQVVPPVQLNGEAVRAALESGETLPFARLGQRGTQLRIR